MARIFEYCVIMRTTDGIEDYLNEGIDRKVECLKNKTAEVLSLLDTISEISLKVIESYLKKKVIENGYIAHTTNSKSVSDIMAYGLSFDENARSATAVL